MGEEKRRYFRWREKIRVAYSLEERSQTYQEIFTEDVSEVGVQILVAQSLAPEQRVSLKLEFVYDSVPIMTQGKVVRIKNLQGQYLIGLEFIEMNDFQRQRLKGCLNKIKEDSKGKVG